MPQVKLLDPTDMQRRLDRYELIGEIASGGMATVFLARLAGVGGFQRFVAIKRLHPHLAAEKEFVDMFLDEARLAAGIHHPHVVPILEVGTTQSGFYLVMEYIEGDTLSRIFARSLSSNKTVPQPIVIRMVLDALAGLHAAHELTDAEGKRVNLVHRDCSPQNILIGVDGCSRITDFGVARASSRLAQTRSDRLKGKLSYMAPEQTKGSGVDRRADLFAMGIVLWEVLAGCRLFKADSEAETLSRVVIEPIPRLKDAMPNMAEALDAVCVKALDRNPDRRYQTALEMYEALEQAAMQSPGVGVAAPREVASYVQSILGQEIAAQRESVRVWLQHESSAAESKGRPIRDMSAKPAAASAGAADASGAPIEAAPISEVDILTTVREPSFTSGSMALAPRPSGQQVILGAPIHVPARRSFVGLIGLVAFVVVLGGSLFVWAMLRPTPVQSDPDLIETVAPAAPSISADTPPLHDTASPTVEPQLPVVIGTTGPAPSASAATVVAPPPSTQGGKAAPPPSTFTPPQPSQTAKTGKTSPPSDDMANPYR